MTRRNFTGQLCHRSTLQCMLLQEELCGGDDGIKNDFSKPSKIQFQQYYSSLYGEKSTKS